MRFPQQPWSEPKIAHFKALKFILMWIKHGIKSISEGAIIGFHHGLPCRVKNMALGPKLRQKPRPSASVFVYWVPRAMFFTRHGRPWSKPTTQYPCVFMNMTLIKTFNFPHWYSLADMYYFFILVTVTITLTFTATRAPITIIQHPTNHWAALILWQPASNSIMTVLSLCLVR